MIPAHAEAERNIRIVAVKTHKTLKTQLGYTTVIGLFLFTVSLIYVKIKRMNL